MLVAVCDQSFGTSTLRCSKITLPLSLWMEAVRISHSTSSKGCPPALVNIRLTLIPRLVAVSAPGPQDWTSIETASRSDIVVRLQRNVGLPQHDLCRCGRVTAGRTGHKKTDRLFVCPVYRSCPSQGGIRHATTLEKLTPHLRFVKR